MVGKNKYLQQLEALGHWFFYVTLHLFGQRGAHILLVPVVLSYVLWSRKIRRTVQPYLKRRFPKASVIGYFRHTFLTVFSFGRVLVERGWLGTVKDACLSGTIEGYEQITAEIAKGKGLVLLTAHMGNWQSALANLGDLPVPVNALMLYDKKAVAKHYFDLNRSKKSFQIIDAEGGFGGMVDSLAALNRGEVVTIMGDRFIKGSSTTVDFLGSEIKLPDSAYMLAASAGAPVAIVFAAQTGGGSYQLKVWDIFYPEYKSRDERGQMLMGCAEKFSSAMEEYLVLYPYQWYNFHNFWKK
ncbi:MAG: lipid A biosynthesis acyltransferase [Desulfotalea sp.]|nr:MAG: lipid A biosynthesis acyltransferase [Desulfotalea sp.]